MSSPTVTLLQDQNTAKDGVNFKWSTTGLSDAKEITLIYFKNAPDADIKSVDVGSNNPRFSLDMDLESGQMYSFQLQFTDVDDVVVYSNTLNISAPYVLTPPIISTVSGVNNGLNVTLASVSHMLSGTDTVEFILKRPDNSFFWIIKPYSSSGYYTLSRSDNAMLVNDITYRLACMYQPNKSNSLYTSPSPMSNSVSATPDNLPESPSNVLLTSIGSSTLDMQVSWSKPSDFSEWSDKPFSIDVLLYKFGYSDPYKYQQYTSDISSHTWTDVDNITSYYVMVKYTNLYGAGPLSTSNTVRPTSVPDVPTILSVTEQDQSVIVNIAYPSFDGQSSINTVKLYRDGVYHRSFPFAPAGQRPNKFLLNTGFANGVAYSLSVTVSNDIGESVLSDAILATPYGQMSINSVIPSGKTLTVSISPNGRPIQEVMLFAVDSDPNTVLDSEFLIVIPQLQISQNATGTIQVVKTFNVSTDIARWYVLARNVSNSASTTSF